MTLYMADASPLENWKFHRQFLAESSIDILTWGFGIEVFTWVLLVRGQCSISIRNILITELAYNAKSESGMEYTTTWSGWIYMYNHTPVNTRLQFHWKDQDLMKTDYPCTSALEYDTLHFQTITDHDYWSESQRWGRKVRSKTSAINGGLNCQTEEEMQKNLTWFLFWGIEISTPVMHSN